MSDNVITLDMPTTLDLPVERLRDNIKWDELDSVLILAFDKDEKFQAYSNKANVALQLLLMEEFRFKLFNGEYR